MNIKTLLVLLLISITFCKEEKDYTATIKFSNDGIDIQGSGVNISETTATIVDEGSYLVTGLAGEGNLVISKSSVEIDLKDLLLSSSTTAPITINNKLKGVKIISLGNVNLKDEEEESTTKGECAVIKIKKKK